jgi:hypothetical protein
MPTIHTAVQPGAEGFKSDLPLLPNQISNKVLEIGGR